MKEKIKKLKDANELLKKEFVGIDQQIDQLTKMISPWYLTPQVLDNPHVISLWGLTGTGKTSVVRRLLNLLDLTGDSIFFDCGENFKDSKSSSLSDQLNNLISGDGNDYNMIDSDPYSSEFDDDQEGGSKRARSLVFVFDEFQYARTINQTGQEVDQPSLRCIWNLLSNGVIDLIEPNYTIDTIYETVYMLEEFVKQVGDMKVTNLTFSKDFSFPAAYKELFTDMFTARSVKYQALGGSNKKKKNSEDEEEEYILFSVSQLRTVLARLNAVKPEYGTQFIQDLYGQTSLSGILDLMYSVKGSLSSSKMINCKNSLVIILGNLDDAFGASAIKSTNPDITAETLHEITSSVNQIKVKEALMEMFRPEQVGRIGNSSIIYPSLDQASFEKIIQDQLNKKAKQFKKLTDLEMTFSEQFKKFIYSEGVYPSLGVRPLVTTINTFLTPHFSHLITEMPEGAESVEIDPATSDFNVDEISINCTFKGPENSDLKSLTITESLELGKLRNPSYCPKIKLYATHEVSHAVVNTILTGKAPLAIVANSLNGGGFIFTDCSSLKKNDVPTFGEVRNEIVVGLAGYFGEREFYPSPSDRSSGCSSDLHKAWESLTNIYYNCGYPGIIETQSELDELDPAIRFSPDHIAAIPEMPGWKDTDSQPITEGLYTVKGRLYAEYHELCEKSRTLVSQNRGLIEKLVEVLVRERSMSRKRFLDLWKQFGGPDINKNENV